MKKILKFYLPIVLWCLVIFLFSAHPQIKTSEIYWQDFILKKSAHISEYAILSFLFYRAFLNEGYKNTDAGFYAILLCIIYAFSDEFHQLFVMGRTSTLRDIVFDTTGASLAVIFGIKFFPKLPLKIRKLFDI